MMKRAALVLLSLLAFAAPAQALKLIVWDNELQTKLGAGESSGSKFNVQLVKDYSGPVKIIFSQSADEKAKGLFPGLQSSYDGVMKNGQLTLLTSTAAKNAVVTSPAATSSTMATPQAGSAAASGLTLTKFLQQFKLNVVNQTTGQTDGAAQSTDEETSAKNGNGGNGNSAAPLEAAPGQNKDKKKP